MRAFCVGLALVLLIGGVSRAEEGTTVRDVDRAIAKGLAWFRAHQNKDGSFGEHHDVGITGMVVTAIARSPEVLRAKDGPLLDRAVAFLLKHARKDGAIVGKKGQLANYKTCIAIMALSAVDPKKHAETIAKARDFVAGLQFDERKGFKRRKSWEYGGIGYGSHEIPDMSNMKFALEALRQAGMDEKSEVFQRAAIFIGRCQNRSESNDVAQTKGAEKVVPGADGGFTYRPVESKAGKIEHEGGGHTFRSYGSMTYAGLLTFVYAGVDRKDPRARAAFNWIRSHYTLDENPGMSAAGGPKPGLQGLYYYYHTFAKALAVYGQRTIVTPKGERHDWASELAARLIRLQRKDGSWVNEHSRWMESSPALVTSYSLLSLATCRQQLEGRR